MLTKPRVFYDHTTKQALGFQNPFYLKKAQQLKPKLYDDPTHSCRPTKVKVPKELPKVNMVNTSLKKLKHHLAGFDMEKGLVITALKDELRKLKGKDLADNVVTKHTIAPEMLKIDVAPLNPRLLNNRSAHSDYLKHTQEEAAILREIVEQGKSQNPLNNSLDSAGVDLFTGSRGNNLYTISLRDMMASSFICLLSKASKTKSWLWHRRLSHLNFGAINHLARHGLVRSFPKLNFKKDHLCFACAMGKSKKKPHKAKSEDTNQEKLYLLHMDLCRPMRIASFNGNKYILVIVDVYSRFTWVKCLRSKDEASDFIIKFLKMIQVRLKVSVRRIRTDNETKFVNHTLREYYEKVGISHETSVARSPQQKSVKDLIYANLKLPATIHGKTPYELLHEKLPELSFFYVFGALRYPTNDSENLEDNHDLDVAHMNNDPFFGIPIPENAYEASSSSDVIPTIVHTTAPNSEHITKWTKDHPLDNIIGELERPVSIRLQLHEQALFCYYDAFLTSVEPKNYKDALTQACWIEAMQEDLNEFERLEVWELVLRPDKVMVITLKWIYKVKLDELGGILKNKARLVARGYRQEEGIDFESSLLQWLD
ncbi:retrovirus-related pol polyprotein from transposon TNT 1-94 [Tanacetum coccineum]